MKLRRLALLLICCFVLVTSISYNNQAIAIEASDDEIDLSNFLLPIETTKAGNGYGDLLFLKEILEDKNIVAMGEATHGTKEFFEMKHRIFEFLVEEMGFRIFAIEDTFGAAVVVNDYILNGIGDAYSVVKGLLLPWTTEEVVDLIEWMRDYNERVDDKDKVKFYGFDLQFVPVNKERLLDYLNIVDNNTYIAHKNGLRYIDKHWSLSKNQTDEINKTLEALEEIFDANRDGYIARSSLKEYQMNYQHINVMKQYMSRKEAQKSKIWTDSANVRDYYMAENVKWILDYEESYYGNNKILLWAHNGHVNKNFQNYTSMGYHLKEAYGDSMYVIGFDFYEGSFRARPLVFGKIINKLAEFTFTGSINSFGYNFYKTGIPIAFLDFTDASVVKNLGEWLSEKQPMRIEEATGTIVPGYIEEVPMDSYDGLIYIEKTAAAIGIEGFEAKIEDGAKYVRNRLLIRYYTPRVIGLISIILLIVYLVKKNKSKNKPAA